MEKPSLGSSPLTRGKRKEAHLAHGRVWLIPAHAGKTVEARDVSTHDRAHPRSRGENWSVLQEIIAFEGSSPLTRGKRLRTP